MHFAEHLRPAGRYQLMAVCWSTETPLRVAAASRPQAQPQAVGDIKDGIAPSALPTTAPEALDED
jgi:hypothetical protein